MNFLRIESIVDGADDVLVNIKPKEKLKKKKNVIGEKIGSRSWFAFL